MWVYRITLQRNGLLKVRAGDRKRGGVTLRLLNFNTRVSTRLKPCVVVPNNKNAVFSDLSAAMQCIVKKISNPIFSVF